MLFIGKKLSGPGFRTITPAHNRHDAALGDNILVSHYVTDKIRAYSEKEYVVIPLLQTKAFTIDFPNKILE